MKRIKHVKGEKENKEYRKVKDSVGPKRPEKGRGKKL